MVIMLGEIHERKEESDNIEIGIIQIVQHITKKKEIWMIINFKRFDILLTKLV